MMSTNEPSVQDFIFRRELAEVYLLLDHLSSRADKSLAAAFGGSDDRTGKGWIEQICEIGWPPKGNIVEQAAQAATLLRAKDHLNSAAKPANGASIAFTLLVVGEDGTPRHGRGRRPVIRHLGNGSVTEPTTNRSETPSVGQSSADLPKLPPDAGDRDPALRPGGFWGDDLAPSRRSLARLAYPGFVAYAVRFNRLNRAVILFLFAWLIGTCMLSWNIATGHAILTRLDGFEARKIDIRKQIASAESEENKRKAPDVASSVHTVSYCDRRYLLGPEEKKTPQGDVIIWRYTDATERQLCEELDAADLDSQASRSNLADWIAPWTLLKQISRLICWGPCLTEVPPFRNKVDVQWAAILIEVITTAVLPLCYGFLGAGAAVVRNIWDKMRDSLLSPRDLTLALGQLALGAVIGACIGLFVTPTGANPSNATLTSSIALSASALSFIAGFGVEGVFVALESLIKRVFNVRSPGA